MAKNFLMYLAFGALSVSAPADARGVNSQQAYCEDYAEGMCEESAFEGYDVYRLCYSTWYKDCDTAFPAAEEPNSAVGFCRALAKFGVICFA
ncbi:hypothetical protein [Sphingomonas koreensis]|jgi:hypothetical protein|uniref:hypothetical protein n=1 Tax=Sphingomonas koreensis TaxID=93064 RepID=UPI000F746C71|nr:hypothetical protein [Sphingomonas koreensis]